LPGQGFTPDYNDMAVMADDVCGNSAYKTAGKIVKTYSRGQTIKIHSVLTANHLGTIEVRICPDKEVSQECNFSKSN
jgi:hypothetical protein